MPYLPLRKIGSGGLVTDQDPYDLELTQFPAGNNVQFHEGRIGKAFGYSLSQSLSFAPTHVESWRYAGNNTLIVGSLTKLYRYNGSTVTNVTKTSDATNYSNSPRWQTVLLGSAMLANNGAETPQFMQPTGTRFADLTAWPTGVTTQCIKPYKSFLIMAGYETASAKFPYTVRWSDAFDPTSIPSTYDIASTTNLAGANVLTGQNGALIDQLPLNNANILYAESGVFTMNFVGGDFIFDFREVFNDDGIINRGAVASFFNQHLVVGQSDIYIHDGNSKKSIVDNKVRRTFYNELVDTRSVFCHSVSSRSEVWICYADEDATDPLSANRALVYNWSQDAFTFVDLPDCRALTTSDVLDTSGAWDGGAAATWAETSEYWSTASLNTTSKGVGVYAASPVANKTFRLISTHGADGTNLNSFLEATKIDFDSVTGKANNNIKQLMGVMPQIEGRGTVQITIGTSDSPQGSTVWKPAVDYVIDTDHKIDVRASGRYFAFRIESTSSDSYWRLTGLDIDIAEVAGR